MDNQRMPQRNTWTNHKDKLSYLVMFFWIILNGSAVIIVNGSYLIPLILSIMLATVLIKSNLMFQKSNLIILVCMLGFLFVSYIVYRKQCWAPQGYFIRGCYLVSAFAMAEQMTYEKFKIVFKNVMCIIAIGSLVMHALGVIVGLNNYAKITGNVMLVGLHNYWAFSSGRNSGMFWEPGAFQIFLNMALVFDISEQKTLTKNDWAKRILLIVTIITTVSTSAYIVLLLNCLKMFIDITKNIKKKQTRIIAWCVFSFFAILMIVACFFSEAIQGKFFRYSGSTQIRFNDLYGSIKLIPDVPFLGTGINTELKDMLLHSEGVLNNSIGVLLSVIMYGLVPTIIYLFLVLKNILFARKENNKLLLLANLFVAIITQAVCDYPIIAVFAFKFKRKNSSSFMK